MRSTVLLTALSVLFLGSILSSGYAGKNSFRRLQQQSSEPETAAANSSNFTAKACPHIIGVSHIVCTQDIVPGCVGYSNGTYEYHDGSNGCKLCADDNVTSFNANESCPASTDNSTGDNFTAKACPHVIGVSHIVCTQDIASGCVGYSNGTYEYRDDSNGCKLCANNNVTSFNANESCPASTDNSTSDNFTAKACPHIIGVSDIVCTQDIAPGCVGYSNGTYEYRDDSNRCKLCANDNVTSFNANQTCPNQ